MAWSGKKLAEAMNARNINFLLGSGCSSFQDEDGTELGIPTMAPMARQFLSKTGEECPDRYVTDDERKTLKDSLGIDLCHADYVRNLEALFNVLHNARSLLRNAQDDKWGDVPAVVDAVIAKATKHVLLLCEAVDLFDDTVSMIYQSFYQRLVFRDRSLPRPWVFTTNYDLFNETAMDRRGIAYCNGFAGVIERRFNPAVYRYTLAEQLDITNRRWSAVDNSIYLCKLHGSVNWLDDGETLFPNRECQEIPKNDRGRVLIYPTPAKQNASFGSPYADLFREFQRQITQDQSVLFVLGYGFGDEHIKTIIFQALTRPNFRLVIFASPDSGGIIGQLRKLDDPRIWIIGTPSGGGQRKAHYFQTFAMDLMPTPPGESADNAINRVLDSLLSRAASKGASASGGTPHRLARGFFVRQ